MPDERVFIIDDTAEGQRLDKWLAGTDMELTRTGVQSLMEKGAVTVNGKAAAKNYKCKKGDNIRVVIPQPQVLSLEPENIPIEIVYEDECIMVVNKPKGMVVHPAPGNYSGTLVNAIMYHCRGRLSSINGVIRPGIVHRIDKNTSGLLMIAKTDSAHNHLAAQIKNHSFTREYQCIAMGRFKEEKFTVDAPIGRNPKDRKKMCVIYTNSKEAVTHFQVLEQFEKCAHLKCTLETGRTHQIRVHLSYSGHPVLGDDVYGKPVKDFQGQCLHAKIIGFIHPETGEYMEFDSELPEYFKKIMSKL